MGAIVDCNAELLPEGDLVRHLMELREQPILRGMAADIGRDEPAVIGGYRVGVAFGAVMMRGWFRQTNAQAEDLLAAADPRRMYLQFPDMGVRTAESRFQTWPLMIEDLSEAHHYAGYITDPGLSETLRALKDQQLDRSFRYLDSPRMSADISYGYFCKGLLEVMAMHEVLAKEKQMTPPHGTVFDPEAHQPVDTSLLDQRTSPWYSHVSFTESSLVLRRYRVGTVLDRPQGSPRPVEVVAAREAYRLRTSDHLIVADRSRDRDYPLFNAMAAPVFVRRALGDPTAEVVALCREGMVHFVTEPNLDPEKNEATLASAFLFVPDSSRAA